MGKGGSRLPVVLPGNHSDWKPQMPGLKWNKRLQLAAFDVRDANGKRRRSVQQFESVEKARGAFVAFRDELRAPHPEPEPIAAAVKTFGQYVEMYWPTMRGKTKEKTFKKDTASVATHLVPFFQADKLEDITQLRIEEYVSACLNRKNEEGADDPVSAPTLNYSLRMLRKILHNARKRKMLGDVPSFKDVFLREATLRNEFSDEERAAYLAAFDDEVAFMAHLAQHRVYGDEATCERYQKARRFGASLKPGSDAAKLFFARFRDAKAWFIVALHTGLRRGDVTNLRWQSVNLKESFVRVTVEKTGREAVVPMSATLRAVLLQRKARPVVSEFVIVNADGHRYADSVINRYHQIAKEIAGITRRVRVHDLRHSFGSLMASAGASELMLKEFFGHGSTKMVQRYSRPSAAAMKVVAAALDRTEAGPDGHLLGHHASNKAEQLIREQQTNSVEPTEFLRFADLEDWSRWPDLNRRPADYESAALPAELQRRSGGVGAAGPSNRTARDSIRLLARCKLPPLWRP